MTNRVPPTNDAPKPILSIGRVQTPNGSRSSSRRDAATSGRDARAPRRSLRAIARGLAIGHAALAFAVDAPLAGTQPLTLEGDLSAQMVAGIDRWLERETARAKEQRPGRWQIPGNDPAAVEKFFTGKRDALRKILGAVDERRSGVFETVRETRRWEPAPAPKPRPLILRDESFSAGRVRWPVFEDVDGLGLLLQPPCEPIALVIVIPDADQAPYLPQGIEGFPPGPPKAVRVALELADVGCLVLVPALVDRRDTWSGSDRLDRFTNQPHREWIYRPAFEMGRTLVGYEVQKVQSAIDALLALAPHAPVGVFGYGEGGLLALHAAALDPRIAATVVSGSFGPRERLWEEPIYRNLFGRLREFGDAELAALVAPRKLLVEQSDVALVDGPPPPRERRAGAAPGKISTPGSAAAAAEVARANQLIGLVPGAAPFRFLPTEKDADCGRDATREAFLTALGVTPVRLGGRFAVAADALESLQRRTVQELEAHTQRLLRESDAQRAPKLWAVLKPGADITAAQAEVRKALWEDVIGKLPTDYLPPNARTRTLPTHDKWTGYEVVLDVQPGVFAWGWLLLPKDLKSGEHRPVVVCQHGLEGLPEDVVTEDQQHRGWRFYKGFASELAARGFIVYAPHNPYRGQDAFRLLQRKANPLGLSLFSFIVAQHDMATRWLAAQPFVDPARIAFYGLSYGGKTAMRVPALLDRYCLAICSGDFNEWIGKCVSTAWTSNYPFTGEWEMPEWNLGHVAGYAEMAMLIAPRPFMVERGHDDGVGLDHWVGYEWGKVRRGYDKLGLGERAEIEWFNGPHTIHGVGTFKFLHRHLRWPER